MHCHACGAEVVQQAVYCHKCGARLDEGMPDPSMAAGGEDVPADPQPISPPPLTAVDILKQATGTRRDHEGDPEIELWQGRYCSKAMIGKWAICSLITLAVLVGGIVWPAKGLTAWAILLGVILIPWIYFGAVLAYRRMNIRYRLTSQRLLHETGVLRRRTDRIETIDMDDITFEQSLMERFVGVGTIRITSSDRTHPELMLEGIENVKQVANQIDEIRRMERRRRGLHIENI